MPFVCFRAKLCTRSHREVQSHNTLFTEKATPLLNVVPSRCEEGAFCGRPALSSRLKLEAHRSATITDRYSTSSTSTSTSTVSYNRRTTRSRFVRTTTHNPSLDSRPANVQPVQVILLLYSTIPLKNQVQW